MAGRVFWKKGSNNSITLYVNPSVKNCKLILVKCVVKVKFNSLMFKVSIKAFAESSSPCHRMKRSSMYLSQSRTCSLNGGMEPTIHSSHQPIRRLAKFGAKHVPIATPCFCLKKSPSNTKKLFSRQ